MSASARRRSQLQQFDQALAEVVQHGHVSQASIKAVADTALACVKVSSSHKSALSHAGRRPHRISRLSIAQVCRSKSQARLLLRFRLDRARLPRCREQASSHERTEGRDSFRHDREVRELPGANRRRYLGERQAGAQGEYSVLRNKALVATSAHAHSPRSAKCYSSGSTPRPSTRICCEH